MLVHWERRYLGQRRNLVPRLLLAFVAFLLVASTTPAWRGTDWGAPQAQAQGEAQPAAFSFVHMTDTHMGSAAGNRATPQVVSEIGALPEKPAFVVVGGDLTELGSREQYDG